jgi:heparosan-N-sulfate-glucuronate 5-epimerase
VTKSLARLVRQPQLRSPFRPNEPASGYYNDLTMVALAHGSPDGARAGFRKLTAQRRLANPVSIAQLGLGAWQLSERQPQWLDVVRDVAGWIVAERDDGGRIRYGFAMPHTYRLAPGWTCGMAQGEAASLLVRAAYAFDDERFLDQARVVATPLVDSSSDLVSSTPDGPVIQEYPTDPPSHVLNGWIFALWGIYDVLHAHTRWLEAASAFESGVAALRARLPLYSTGWQWSRYDLFPHRIDHVTSPFYHRLHIEQLRALADLVEQRQALLETADCWERGLRNPAVRTLAIGRKVAFRMLEPRRDIV